MFKIPDWDNDVPKNEVLFASKAKKNKKKVITQAPVKIANGHSKEASQKVNFTQDKKTNLKFKSKQKLEKLKNATPNKSEHGSVAKKFLKKAETVNQESSKKYQKKTIQASLPVKQKLNSNNKNKKSGDTSDLQHKDFNTDKLDEVLIDNKKKKLKEAFEKDDQEDVLFYEQPKKKKVKNKNFESINNSKGLNTKKAKLKAMLKNSNRTSINVQGNLLRERMLERLKAAQFRFLNEKLYTASGSEALQLFQQDPAAFHTYHQGYQQQLKKWPVNPLDVIVKKIMKMPKTHLIADMGCGEAALSQRVPHTVRSFDLVAATPAVETCDMAHTPLQAASVDAVVYCLALMGTDLTQYLLEANRVLKTGGHLLVAEVESRFDDVNSFTKLVEQLGFKLKDLDKSNMVFFFMEFTKNRDPPKKSKQPHMSLKPCFYKKR